MIQAARARLLQLTPDAEFSADRVAFARAAGFEPDPWQVRALRSEAPQQIWLCARQVGKSTTAALISMHTVMYHANTLVLLLSPTLRQSGELFKRCLNIYRTLG